MRIVSLGDLEQTDLTCTSTHSTHPQPIAHPQLTLRTDSGAATYMWSQIEPSAAILCACFVTYRPLFRDMSLRSIFTRSNASTEPSDVSRRFPTLKSSEMSSEDGLVEHKGGMGH